MNKNRRGVRTYRPHGLSVFIYALFALAVVACLAAFVYFPFFTFNNGSDTVFTGLDYVKHLADRFCNVAGLNYGGFAVSKFEDFTAYMEHAANGDYTIDNQLLLFIIKFAKWIDIALASLFGISAFFAALLVIFTLLFVIIGKLSHPKCLRVFSWLSFWFFAAGFGLTFLYFIFYLQIVGFSGDTVTITLSIESLIALGAMFVLCIIVAIIHKAGFKDRVPFSKKRTRDEESVIVDNSSSSNTQAYAAPQPQVIVVQQPQPQVMAQPQPQVIVQPQPQVVAQPQVQVNPEPSEPKGSDVITVGERAYAKNTEIRVVNIPEGIVSLGSSAFANCVNLTAISIPSTVKEIGFNCFFNTPKLDNIAYNGTIEQWKSIQRGSNWLVKSGTKTVRCLDGLLNVNPRH